MVGMIPMTPTTSYAPEIQSMLFGFGDCDRPLMETAQLVEEIAHDQMRRILFLATAASENRGAKIVGLEDAVFVMRRNPVKVQRLMRYLSVKEAAASAVASSANVAGGENSGGGGGGSVKRCRDFLLRIDTNGQLLQAANEELRDEARVQRLKRMDRLSRILDGRRYEEFTRARQVGFLGPKLRYQQKFQDWLTKGSSSSADYLPKIDKSAIEVLGYLAYETVGQIVELTIMTRKDMEDSDGDGDNVDCWHQWEARPQAAAAAAAKVRAAAAATGEDDAPAVEDDAAAAAVLAAAAAAAAAATTTVSVPVASTLVAESFKEDTAPRKLEARPLKPEHVREALRRLGQMPRSVFGGWGDRVDAAHSKSEIELPLLAI